MTQQNDPRFRGTALSLRSEGPGGFGAPPPPPGDEGIDMNHVGAALRDNLRLILRIAGAVFAVVMIATLAAYMEFRSSARLYLGDLNAKQTAKSASPGQDLDLDGVAGDMGSEVEILKSRSLVSRAILSSGLNVTLMRPGWKPPRYVRWRLSRRDMALLDAAGGEVFAVDTGAANLYRGERAFEIYFRSETEYEVRSQEGSLGTGKLGEPAKLNGITLTLHPGEHARPASSSRYTLVVHALDGVIDETLEDLQVNVPKSDGTEPAKVLTLEFKHASPFFAATFLRELMDSYLNERQAWKSENATAAEAFVSGQLDSLRGSLDTTQKKLAEFRSNTRVVVLNDEAKAMIEQMSKYEQQRVAARLEVAALADMKRAIKNPHSRLEAFMLGEANDTVLKELATSLSKARNELTDLEQRFNDESPDLRNQRARVTAQAEMVRNYIDGRAERAQDNLSTLNGVIQQMEAKLKTVPGAELGLAQMTRDSEVYNRMYSYLLERQQQAGIIKAATMSKNRVLDPPTLPFREDTPKLALRLASLLLGLLLGVLVVLVRRFLSPTIQSERELQVSVRGVNVFAYVPRETSTAALSDAMPSSSMPMLTVARRSAFAEAFRTLRTNLSLTSWSGTGNVVLITSPCPGDGKTTTTLSLAAVLAADGRQVLVIDADLRKPSHHEFLNLSNELGLQGVLSGQYHWRDAVRPVSSSFGEFYSIGAGKAAGSDLLSGERMSRLLTETRARFDYVLIDSASFPLVADALILSREADCVVSVLRLQHTPRKLINDHMRRLSESARNYGVVVNDARSSGDAYAGVYPGSAPMPPGSAVSRVVNSAVQGLSRTGKKN